jgi:hypothetical protein
MTTPDERSELRATFREVTLTVLGVFEMYEADPAIATAIARGIGDVLRARLPEIARPRAAKGRAALRALLNEIERTNDVTG